MRICSVVEGVAVTDRPSECDLLVRDELASKLRPEHQNCLEIAENGIKSPKFFGACGGQKERAMRERLGKSNVPGQPKSNEQVEILGTISDDHVGRPGEAPCAGVRGSPRLLRICTPSYHAETMLTPVRTIVFILGR